MGFLGAPGDSDDSQDEIFHFNASAMRILAQAFCSMVQRLTNLLIVRRSVKDPSTISIYVYIFNNFSDKMHFCVWYEKWKKLTAGWKSFVFHRQIIVSSLSLSLSNSGCCRIKSKKKVNVRTNCADCDMWTVNVLTEMATVLEDMQYS